MLYNIFYYGLGIFLCVIPVVSLINFIVSDLKN
jgi:hypothetical protein